MRLFARSGGQWWQLGFPSAFAMARDRVRWIYSTSDCVFELVASVTTDTLEYRAFPLRGALPALRLTWEVCGEPNEFDSAPRVEWDAAARLLTVAPGARLAAGPEIPRGVSAGQARCARLHSGRCQAAGREP